MTTTVPPVSGSCTTYTWCRSKHARPGEPHIHYFDLVEHLDDSNCMVEVSAKDYGPGQRVVEVVLTDNDPEHTEYVIPLQPDVAGALARIIELFDRRGLREIGQLLAEGAVMLAEVAE